MKNLHLEYRLRKLEKKYNEAKQAGDIYHVTELSVAGDQVLENLSTVDDGIAMCIA